MISPLNTQNRSTTRTRGTCPSNPNSLSHPGTLSSVTFAHHASSNLLDFVSVTIDSLSPLPHWTHWFTLLSAPSSISLYPQPQSLFFFFNALTSPNSDNHSIPDLSVTNSTPFQQLLASFLFTICMYSTWLLVPFFSSSWNHNVTFSSSSVW